MDEGNLEKRILELEKNLVRQISLTRSMLIALSIFVLLVVGIVSGLSTTQFFILMGFWIVIFFAIAILYEFIERREKAKTSTFSPSQTSETELEPNKPQ